MSEKNIGSNSSRRGRSAGQPTQEDKYIRYSRYAATQREVLERKPRYRKQEEAPDDYSQLRQRSEEVVMAERIRERIERAQQQKAADESLSEKAEDRTIKAGSVISETEKAAAEDGQADKLPEEEGRNKTVKKPKKDAVRKKTVRNAVKKDTEKKEIEKKDTDREGAMRKPASSKRKQSSRKRKKPSLTTGIFIALIVLTLLTAGIWYLVVIRDVSVSDVFSTRLPSIIAEELGSSSKKNGSGSESKEDGDEEAIGEDAMAETETEMPAEEAEIPFTAACTLNTLPSNMIDYTELEYNGQLITPDEFKPWYNMDFGYGEKYAKLDGVISFRGNNFRNAPAYGSANITQHKLATKWSADTGGLSYGGTSWSGSGWTGQPLIVKWPKETKAAMNMYDWAKADDSLVEVIYACMDGFVYFFDLRSGQKTRQDLYLGYTFKGAGALDPRGYPIMYLGAGYDSYEGKARVFVINLLDCSVMYTFGNGDPFCLRGNLSFFDGSALVDEASDTLVYPGENGIVYLIHLNTQYDPKAGTLSIDPDKVLKWHYYGKRSNANSYWIGMEDSPAVYKGYLYIADNGGHLMCLNLNTMKLEWVQDILDDSNSTPVLSVENGHLYLYVSTSFRLGWRSYGTATVPVWKIDAANGEIVWQHDYNCYTMDGVSGGVQSTIALGSGDLEGKLYVTVSMTDSTYAGVLACLDRGSGETVWEHHANYAWSSPVCVKNNSGNDDVLYCDSSGNMYLLDGLSGKVHDTISLSEGVIEASPAVYDDRIVVGTRACKIWGLELK